MSTNIKNKRLIYSKIIQNSVLLTTGIICSFISTESTAQNSQNTYSNNNSIIISVNDISICYGETGTLVVNGNAESYKLISPTNITCLTTNSITVNPSTSTTYTVVGTIGQLESSVTANVFVSALPNLSITANKTAICEGDSIVFTTSGADNYNWGNNNSLNCSISGAVIAKPIFSTTYTVIASNTGNGLICSNSGTIDVTVHPLPYVNAGNDTTILYGDYLELTSNSNEISSWHGENINCNRCSKTYLAPTQNICYTLEVTDQYGCKNTDVKCVEVKKEFSLFMPNSFTPNEDDLNDTYMIAGIGIEEFEMIIYDRWGNLIYKTNDMTKGWNGKHHGLACSNGIYICQVTVKSFEQKTETKYQNITLIGTNNEN